jgi:hypothetical protein
VRRPIATLVLVTACQFSPPAALTPDVEVPVVCGGEPWWDARWGHRFAIDPAGAPADYTLRLDVSGALVSSQLADDLRVIVEDAGTMRELDRVLDGSMLELRVPASGALWLYAGNAAATAPPADPAAVYAWSESFDTLAIDGDGSPRFEPVPAPEWRVVDDGGNHIYRALGVGRHPAPIAGLALASGEIRARVRVGPGGTQNHNGVLVRASSTVPAVLDGYVGQILEDVDGTRIAEYTDGISPPAELDRIARPVDRATWYQLRLWFAGPVIEVHVDGVLEARITNALANGERIGLFAHDTDVDFDDVRVRAIVDPEPVATLGPRESCP